MSLRTVVEAFEKVAATSKRTEKLAILNELHKADPTTFKEVVEYTAYPFWTYRITAPDVFNMTPKFDDLNDAQSDAMWVYFKVLLDSLRRREYEQLAHQKNEVRDLMGSQPALYRKYLAQIVNRELKIGVQSFDKWFPSMIPAEPVMLCDKYDGEDLAGNWTAEPKLDGYRSAVMVLGDSIDAVSRGNKEFWNWEHIAEQIKAVGLTNGVLDGEFYAGNFGLTGSICKTQSPHKDRMKLRYHMFDLLTTPEWSQQKCSRTTAQRKQLAYDFFWSKGFRPVAGSVDLVSAEYPNLVWVVGVPVHSPEEFMEAADMFYLQGYEGTVLKEMSSVYVWDRSSLWLKIKPEEDADVTITGAELGDAGKKHENRLGRLIVSGNVTYKKKQFDIISRVGNGFTDDQRDELWALHQAGKLVGVVIEVSYQDVTSEVTMVQGVPALRFPKFRRVRWDKTSIELGGK